MNLEKDEKGNTYITQQKIAIIQFMTHLKKIGDILFDLIVGRCYFKNDDKTDIR